MTDVLSTLTYPVLGGALIGLSASLLLLSHGKIAGISGIFSGLFQPNIDDHGYRVWFLSGLVLAGLVARFVAPQAFGVPITTSLLLVAVAGLLVGLGTKLANGCTSGHGVCGVSRLSARSVVATVTFIAAGVVTTFFVGGRS